MTYMERSPSLSKPRNITLQGEVTGAVSFDGSKDVILYTALTESYLQRDGDTSRNLKLAGIDFTNLEASTNDFYDGRLMFDSSTGLSIGRSQHAGDANTEGFYPILDGANIASGTGIIISGNDVNSSGLTPITFTADIGTNSDQVASGDHVHIGVGIPAPETINTTNFTLENGKHYQVDASSSSITATIPNTLPVGAWFIIGDYEGSANTNNIVLTSTDNIYNSTENFEIDSNNYCALWMKVDSVQGWKMLYSIGENNFTDTVSRWG